MKPTPLADATLAYPLASNETRATYCRARKALMFRSAASDQVIKLTGEWPCTTITTSVKPNITLDLEDFNAPDLTHIVGNETLDIYNWNFEKVYASHESVSPISTVRNIYNSRIAVSRPNDPLDSQHHSIGDIYGEMAFCEIKLTHAPAGCKCIGTVMPGAKICSNNTFSYLALRETVSSPEPQVVTLTNPPGPVITAHGLPPTLTVTTKKDVDIRVHHSATKQT